MLHEVAELLPVLAPAVVARLKVLAGMDIAVHRNPQDGRFSATINGKSLDVRASTFPTIWGEKAVLRLLDRSSLHRSPSHVMSGRPLDSVPRADPAERRHRARHRPDRQRQDVDALCRAGRARGIRQERRHGRGPVEYLAARRQSEPDQSEGGLHVRAGTARDSPPGSERHHGRRDSRPRDAEHRHRSVADGPPRALDAAHQRRRRDADAAARDGRRALPARVVDGRRRRTAARSQDLRVIASGRFPFRSRSSICSATTRRRRSFKASAAPSVEASAISVASASSSS